ncbi:MAG: 3-oxoacyl-(acyl-carrier-protein) reductase [Frankiales bacterium]|jgi:3-oxoacyl-[acyl-carrier protein] reductase|nr:3-oxoacyl-(acyl-carrier-protein) reductase [Frankiales bacterium]
METGLKGRVAVVTGGSRGIGYATASRMLQEGAQVVLMSRNSSELAEAASRLEDEVPGAQVGHLAVDVSDADSVAAAAARVADDHGSVHVLVNNAGPILQGAPVTGSSDDKWLRTYNIKTMGMLRMARAFAPGMPADGSARIVNVSGVSGRSLLSNSSASGMANAAVCALTSYLAQEFAPARVNVNCVSPGLIRTAAWAENAERLGEPLGMTGSEYMHDFQQQLGVRLGRWAEPTEVADVIVFFASDRASYVTGQVLAVDGGLESSVI